MLAAGGTIGMSPSGDGGAVPRLDAEALVEAVPVLAKVPGLRARTVSTRPSVQLTAGEALDIARAAAAEADAGRGVVVTHGTDTLEEVALLTRPALRRRGADRVHRRDAARLGARAPTAPPTCSTRSWWRAPPVPTGLGVLVVFAGAVHAARAVRKADSTAPAAFDSPRLGPIGRVQEGRAWMARRLERFPPVPVASLDATVHIVPAALGADGSLAVAAVEAGADGLVAVVLGAGHTPPPFLAALKRAATRVPVVVTVRPERGSILRETYAFEGAERDLRSGPLICAAALSPAAARIKLMACLGAGYARGAIAGAFTPDDF